MKEEEEREREGWAKNERKKTFVFPFFPGECDDGSLPEKEKHFSKVFYINV